MHMQGYSIVPLDSSYEPSGLLLAESNEPYGTADACDSGRLLDKATGRTGAASTATLTRQGTPLASVMA
jgi:hypothetical protein